MAKKTSPKKYSELKQKVSFSLTKTGLLLFEQQANALGLNRSELLEEIARGTLSLHPDKRLLGES